MPEHNYAYALKKKAGEKYIGLEAYLKPIFLNKMEIYYQYR